MQVALRNGGKLRHRTGGDVFDVIPSGFQNAAGNMGRHMLPGPFVDCDFDRIAAVGHGAAAQSQHCEAQNARGFGKFCHGTSLVIAHLQLPRLRRR